MLAYFYEKFPASSSAIRSDLTSERVDQFVDNYINKEKMISTIYQHSVDNHSCYLGYPQLKHIPSYQNFLCFAMLYKNYPQSSSVVNMSLSTSCELVKKLSICCC